MRRVNVLRRLPTILDAVPVHQVDASQGPFAYRSGGEDPQFQLVPRNGRFPTGWVHLTVEMKAGPDFQFEPRLYIDSGAGFSEPNQICLPLPKGEAARGVIFLPTVVKALRFDPAMQEGSFFVGPFVFQEIGSAEMLATKCAWFFSDVRKTSLALRGKLEHP